MEKIPKALCIFTRILGWNTFSEYVYSSLNRIPNFDYDIVEYGHQDTWSFKAPKYLSLSMDMDSAWRMGKVLQAKKIDLSTYDTIIIQGHQLAIPIRKHLQDKHVVVISDTTPKLAHRGNKRWESKIKHNIKNVFIFAIHHLIYKPLFREVNQFLVLSEVAKKSLITDYNVEQDHVSVLHPPLLGIEYESSATSYLPENSLPNLLFIGNAFERKGGIFLLSIFEKHLSGKANLIIVSNDKLLADLSLPGGVVHLKDIPHNAIFDLFAKCDIFLFPTFKDEMGLVLSEALAVGTPIIARNAGAQSEYVKNNENGILLPYESNEASWITAINQLLSDREKIAEFRLASKALADKILDGCRFDQTVKAAILCDEYKI